MAPPTVDMASSKGPMRLLFVLDSFGAGGAQRQMVTLAHGLTARGHAVEFFVYHPEHRYFRPEVDAAGIPVHEVPKRARFSPAPVLALRRLASGVDGVLAFLQTPSVYALAAGLGRRRPVVVVSERSADRAGGISLARRVLESAYLLADGVVVNSHHHRLALAQRRPWLRGRLVTIINGLDLDRFCPAASPREPSDGLRLLAVGKVQPGKNVLGLVRALAVYRDRYGVPPEVAWAGRDGDGSGARREAEALLHELDLARHWHWLGERDDVHTLYQGFDALIHPSFLEGFPNAVCEALASGLPVLASRVGDHALLVEEGVRGFLFDPADPQEMSSALHRLAALGKGGRAEMGCRARRFAEEHLGARALADAYERLFGSLLGRTS